MTNAHRTRLILASQSPRRSELLDSAGLSFEVIPANISESRYPDEPAEPFVKRMAREKAESVAATVVKGDRSAVVLGADTIVVVDGDVLGKPRDRAEAAFMLNSLSGRAHRVLTAVCVIADSTCYQRHVSTTVFFRTLQHGEIEAYLDRAQWHDKAGGYAIQQHAAYMVSKIDGSVSNVIGLPLSETVDLLQLVGLKHPHDGS